MINTQRLDWHGLSRKAIPGVMLGMEPVAGPRESSPERALSYSEAGLAVAFNAEGSTERRAPLVALVEPTKVSDLLSWLHTYSAETFPLSQYCRVLTIDDWRLASEEHREPSGDLSCWASVVAGEMLGQGDLSSSIASTPLSWAHACSSFAMARTMRIYGERSEQVTTLVAERLGMFERNSKFQSRRIEQFALQPIWAMASSGQDFDGHTPDDIANTVIEALNSTLAEKLRSNRALRSSSAEQRVVGFEEVAKEAIGQVVVGGPHRRPGAALLAAAAFLAGNGTSHIGLLDAHAKRCPEVYAWFGLFAGLAGPAVWDSAWMRLTKGTQRLLAASHRLIDAPQVDLSWVEHAWLSSTSLDTDVYSAVPRSSPRVLAIELLPGVSCQFRMTGVHAPAEPSPKSVASAAVPSGATLSELQRVVDLAAEIQAVLARAVGSSAPQRQTHLFEGGQSFGSGKKKSSRAKPKP